MDLNNTPYKELAAELEEVKRQLYEANEAIDAIRTGQIDALVVEGSTGHQLYTLKSADLTYRVFIEKMTEGAVTLNKEGNIMYCNQQFSMMVGSPLSRIIGLPFSDYVTGASKPAYLDIFSRCWNEDCKGEVVLNDTDHEIPVLLSLTALHLEDGVSLSMIITDLSRLKQNEEELKENNRQLEAANRELALSNQDLLQFASVASHDLQEPLRKIQMFSELLGSRGSSELTAESAKYLNKIQSSAGRMKNLVLDILNYSKLSSTTNPYGQVDLGDLLQEVVDDLDMIKNEKDASIVYDDLPTLRVNRGQIRQVFQNIISNGIKFSREGVPPVLTISAKKIGSKSFNSPEDRSGEYCLINIRDNGIGFDTKYLQNIFVLFERLHSKDTFEGTGIGLAVSKKIIEKHDGMITAESVPGQGSTFKIILRA